MASRRTRATATKEDRVSEVTVRRCDHCGEAIAESARRFLLRATLSSVNGDIKTARACEYAETLDLCSVACILAVTKSLIERVTA